MTIITTLSIPPDGKNGLFIGPFARLDRMERPSVDSPEWRIGSGSSTVRRQAVTGRTRAVRAEPGAMPRPLPALSEPDLEREMLRKSVGALRADRTRCADCGRTPLVGEQVHVYARGAVVCELCRLTRRDAPERSYPVAHSERGQAVRVRDRRAP